MEREGALPCSQETPSPKLVVKFRIMLAFMDREY
jgi:hypothetical protein